MTRAVCESVVGGWQSCDADTGNKFGPVFNDVADLWEWQRGFDRRRVILDNMTPEQAETLLTFYVRQRAESPKPKSWDSFFGGCAWNSLLGCLMMPYAGMVVGIERDGYAHS